MGSWFWFSLAGKTGKEEHAQSEMEVAVVAVHIGASQESKNVTGSGA